MNFVEHILNAARKRLAVLSREAALADTAVVLTNPSTPLAVVCDEKSIAVGVISSTDLVKVLASARDDALHMNAGVIMSKPVISCHLDDSLQQVWSIINPRSLRCIPLIGNDGRPRGVL